METASPLLGNAPDAELVEKIEAVVRENPETIGIHDLVVHDYGPNKIFVSLHMEVDGSKNLFLLHDAVDLAEREISQQLGCEAVIHMDPIDLSNPGAAGALRKNFRRSGKDCAGDFDSRLPHGSRADAHKSDF